MLDTIVKPVVNGFRLLASEAKWGFIKGVRRWEIRQLRKRLDEEYLNLGRSYATSQNFDPKSSDNDLTLRQISFLREELDHLEKELAATRAEFIKNRTGESGRGE